MEQRDARGGIRRKSYEYRIHLGEGVVMVQAESNGAEVAIKMLGEEVPEEFVAFGFRESAWAEIIVLLDASVAVADASNPESINS
jgi:hypothetical protein